MTRVHNKRNRLDRALGRFEIRMILKAYEMANRSKTKASTLLGIKRTRLIEILRRHNRLDLIYATIPKGGKRNGTLQQAK